MTLQRYGNFMTLSLFCVTFTFVFVSIVPEVTNDIISCNSFNIVLIDLPDGKYLKTNKFRRLERLLDGSRAEQIVGAFALSRLQALTLQGHI